MSIISPKEFFGFTPGDDGELARWDKIVEYFYILDEASDRITVRNMGDSTEGNPFIVATITSSENHKNLEKYRKMSMLLSDPRGATEAQISEAVECGKAVCLQTMSLHGNEVGGTQMAINLAYDLVVKDDSETAEILDNTILLLVPCFNPDGEILMTDWYYSTKGTEYEGSDSPHIFHTYSGHDNNRDAMYLNLPESRYVAQLMFKEWMPQAYVDHHHMGSYGARQEIVPYKNPLRPGVDPIVWRELNWYGAEIAKFDESQGIKGVSAAATYPGWQHMGFYGLGNNHNIASILTETATAKLATPKYIDPTQIKSNGVSIEPYMMYTSPWEGGWWHLSDIVKLQYNAAFAVLRAMARNRRDVLSDMAVKARRQTERGEKSTMYAYIIPENQHDKSEMRHLISILLGQNIEIHRAKADFTVGNTLYKKGTYVVFLAQPKYGVITNLVGQTFYPDNQWTRNHETGVVGGYDSFTDTINEFLGVEVIPANARFDGDFEIIDEVEHLYTVEKSQMVILDARENTAYKAVNLMLRNGIKVYRTNSENHDFYAEGDAEKIAQILTEAKTVHYALTKVPENLTPVKPMRVAVYQRYYYGNPTEGWTRFALDQNYFEYTTVHDKEILDGLDGYDALVISGDYLAFLLGLKECPRGAIHGFIQWLLEFSGPQPVEYQSGFGIAGARAIAEFVERGGRLIAHDKTSNFAIEYLNLGVKNIVRSSHPKEYNTHGSTLHVHVDTDSPIAYGMPKEALILNYNSPVFQIDDKFDADKYNAVLRYPEKNLLRSGYLHGEKLIVNKAALVECKKGKGEVVLYGFEPYWRAQTAGTCKLFFNKLYK